jgi:hypothetical protein
MAEDDRPGFAETRESSVEKIRLRLGAPHLAARSRAVAETLPAMTRHLRAAP